MVFWNSEIWFSELGFRIIPWDKECLKKQKLELTKLCVAFVFNIKNYFLAYILIRK